ncbi:MBL fold metallo-hydrolase [Aliikangiella sp. IMCC44359]|uniref:MBL fold metallo-hydrolase n=1 Tax=Aliikangiella sp. IMCC44359 TaxID=3459125 RepID=UPI00403AA247
MELIFLGTSSGVPTKNRNVSGLAIKMQKNKHWYLVDCGEATQHQILHTKLSIKYLEAIFITHVHGDHCYGLPGLLASMSMAGKTEMLTIVAPKNIEKMILCISSDFI